MCLDGFFTAKVLRRLLRPVRSSVPVAAAADRLEQQRPLLADTGRDDVVVLERCVHRQLMSEMDGYRTSLLHLQQVLLQQVTTSADNFLLKIVCGKDYAICILHYN